MEILVLLYIVMGLATYLIPTFIACIRGHSNSLSILLINILFGWTLLGWLAALIWSFVDNKSHQSHVYSGDLADNVLKNLNSRNK